MFSVKMKQDTAAGSGQKAQREETGSLITSSSACKLGRFTGLEAVGLSFLPHHADQAEAECSPKPGMAQGAQHA